MRFSSHDACFKVRFLLFFMSRASLMGDKLGHLIGPSVIVRVQLVFALSPSESRPAKASIVSKFT